MAFINDISTFTKVSSDQAREGLSSEDYILFIGRASCPFCNRFAPKLRAVADHHNLSVNFLDSDDFSDSGISILREHYQVPTVPGLLVAKNGQVKVVCDSSLSEDAILSIIQEG